MPHRKQLKRFHEPGHLHEFTFSCDQRRPLLTHEVWLKWLAGTLTEACRFEQVELVAFVFMPEQVHFLLARKEPIHEMRRIPAAIQSPVSRQAKVFPPAAGEVDGLQRLTVERGDRTERPTDWKWSSAPVTLAHASGSGIDLLGLRAGGCDWAVITEIAYINPG
ncbi:hypothetical protein [Planctomicrobium sp. SH664]|uniref:hypothetical protein n=1 Tax=Planctomicrobium sp. SH664 TaxID=3448125 RepID=UPI003F5C38D2